MNSLSIKISTLKMFRKNLITTFRKFSSKSPELSETKFNVNRKAFEKINQNHLSFFRSVLGNDRVVTDSDEVLPYNIDWIMNYRGQSQVVLKPVSTNEVSSILSFCNENNLAVCPQGGNTGLVGGSVPVFDEIVLSTALMNKIISLDKTSGILVCEAGCILENLNNYLNENNLLMPLDLGAKGSCHIGGNVSTNAGGLRLLRYGNLHGTVLGVEAVKANGEIIDCLASLKKDNTGYHLKHLFIGSEGTLGFITKVSIQCPALPSSVNVAFLGVNSYDDVLTIFRKAKSELGEILSAFEMADATSIETSVKNLNLKNPIGDFPFYILIETSGSNETHDLEKLSTFLEKEMGSGIVLDGTFCSEPNRIQSIWALREGIPVAMNKNGYVLKYDISLPLDKYYEIVPIMRERLGKDAIVCGFGHIGDGNIHLNINIKEYSKEILKQIEPFVYEFVSKVSGSISAEHGIGFLKPKYMHYSKNESCIGLMKELKSLMDPKGILNPYKVLPN